MASVVYNSFKRDIMNGSIDLDTDTIKVMLVTSNRQPRMRCTSILVRRICWPRTARCSCDGKSPTRPAA
jgi:hypothetical protein